MGCRVPVKKGLVENSMSLSFISKQTHRHTHRHTETYIHTLIQVFHGLIVNSDVGIQFRSMAVRICYSGSLKFSMVPITGKRMKQKVRCVYASLFSTDILPAALFFGQS